MNTVIRKTKWMSVGLLVALTCGAPAIADDTELLLVNPNEDTQTTPNVLFIIDSSGSMGNQEETREVYDYTLPYAGIAGAACDPDYLYWTPFKKVRPSCVSDQRILKTAFKCNAGQRQLQGIGIYRNTMAQYRDGSSGFFSIFLGLDTNRWQQLEAGNETDIVECKKDRGEHGIDAASDEVWVQRGGDRDPYTTDNKEEVSWKSWPTSESITMYDGNYLNYLENPTLIMDSRINIVNNTASAILNSIDGINVGIMRFNNTQGGPVIQAVKDLDTNRAETLDTIDNIVAGGWTPVSETFYEAARYWHGLPAHYGELIDEHTTDPLALDSAEPEDYKQPMGEVCSKNFTVILTDGAPTEDVDTVNQVGNLPNWFGTLGYAGCTGAGNGACLDDVAEYLYQNDISNEPGRQVVITHTIGFAIDLPILKETAQRGGGDYFLADDIESLTLALLEIVNDINDRSLSFAAPAVAVNTFNRTRNLNDLYLTTFAASEKARWPGNLKKYKIKDGLIVDRNEVEAVNPATGTFYDTASSFWSLATDGNDVTLGGAAAQLPGSAARNLYTDNVADPDLTIGANTLTVANKDSFVDADFGLSGSADEPTREEMIRWMRGEDVLDEDLDPATTERKAMGDPLHSQPAAVVYGGDEANPEVVVFAATNDGYVHAVDAATGQELWAFVPKQHLVSIPTLFINPDMPFKNYGVDGDIIPVVADRDDDGVIEPADGDFVYILFGMRRGGSAYYALDVTNKNSPKVQWRVDAAEFGQSWSRPTVVRMDINDPGLNADKAVVVIGGGYDSVHDTMTHPADADSQGAGIYFLDLQSGEMLWRAGRDDDANLQLPGMTRAIPSQVVVADVNGDLFADRMYASDMGGQILRFDIFRGKDPDGTGADALVTGGVVAQLGAEALGAPSDADTRRFYTSPDISVFNDNIQNRRFLAISIGSGYRAHPLDTSNEDRFYSIRDENVFNQLSQADYDGFVPVTDAELVEVSGSVGTVIGQNQRGWKFTLPPEQMVLSTSVTFNNEIFFVAFSPDASGAAICSAGVGRNFLYRVKVGNGDPIADRNAIVPGTEDEERVTDLAQGGIAPSPRFLFPTPDPNCVGDECKEPPLGCIGVECFDPGFANNPVRTLWTQDGVE